MNLDQMKEDVLKDWVGACAVDRAFLRSLLRELLNHYTDDEIVRAHTDAFGDMDPEDS